HHEAVDTHKQMQEFTITYLSFRNRIASFLMNLHWINATKILSVLLVIYAALILFYLATLRPQLAWAIVLAGVWNIRHIRLTLGKRDHVQTQVRKRSDRELFRSIKRNPPVVYYYYLFTTLKNFRYEKAVS
ncbi:MAG: hypothetical protein UV66_C0008G0001, partial [Candidatus Woesebacteria bacterium GW2011_GWA1_43_12]